MFKVSTATLSRQNEETSCQKHMLRTRFPNVSQFCHTGILFCHEANIFCCFKQCQPCGKTAKHLSTAKVSGKVQGNLYLQYLPHQSAQAVQFLIDLQTKQFCIGKISVYKHCFCYLMYQQFSGWHIFKITVGEVSDIFAILKRTWGLC